MLLFGKKRKIVLPEEAQETTQTYQVDSGNVELKKAYVEEVLRHKKLPIVLLDPLWLTIRENIRSDIIKKKEKKLQGLLMEQGKLNNDLKDYNVVKQNFLRDILELSGNITTEGDKSIEELNKLHQTTLATNDKIAAIEKRLFEVEEEIETVNHEIVEEMIAVGYEFVEAQRKRNVQLDKDINSLRVEMLQKTEEKKKGEKKLKDIYNYLHNIVGREQIEIIDKTLGDKNK